MLWNWKITLLFLGIAPSILLIFRFIMNIPINHATTYSIHQKCWLSHYFRNQLADHSLIVNFRHKFVDVTFVMGNWSAPNSRLRKPIYGVVFKRPLQKHGFHVLLIDESQTSRCCPRREEMTFETFRMALNPCTYKIQSRTYFIRHGLLWCTNQNCRVPVINNNGMLTIRNNFVSGSAI